jgi:hypothetical protein
MSEAQRQANGSDQLSTKTLCADQAPADILMLLLFFGSSTGYGSQNAYLLHVVTACPVEEVGKWTWLARIPSAEPHGSGPPFPHNRPASLIVSLLANAGRGRLTDNTGTTSKLPYLVICAVLYFVCFYDTVGFPSGCNKAGAIFFVILMYEFIYIGIGPFVAVYAPNATLAPLVKLLLLATLIPFCGVLVSYT